MSITVPDRERLAALRDAIGRGLVERDVPVRLALLAALSGEHLLLLGPPGTAKSELARRLRTAFTDAAWFERLLTRFTVPEELFGPLSLKALEQDTYRRQTAGYLPSASVAFLDELFKASSAILNALLTLLNEREFDNGTAREKVPLVCVVAASNELPDDEGGDALYDRFLLRCTVGPVSEAGFTALLSEGSETAPLPEGLALTREELGAIREGARSVKLGSDVVALLGALRRHLAEQGVVVSDRRWVKAAGLLRTSAFTDGRAEVSLWDCWLLVHCVWNKPEEREAVSRWFDARISALAAEPSALIRLTEAWERRIAAESGAEMQARDDEGRPLFVTSGGRVTTEPESLVHKRDAAGEALYKSPGSTFGPGGISPGDAVTYEQLWKAHFDATANIDIEAYIRRDDSKVMESVKHAPHLVPRRVEAAAILRLLADVTKQRERLETHLTQLDRRIGWLENSAANHLWVPKELAEAARPRWRASREAHESLLHRWRELERGFSALMNRS